MTATALLLIDLQHAFAMRTAAGVPRSNPGAEATISRLVSQTSQAVSRCPAPRPCRANRCFSKPDHQVSAAPGYPPHCRKWGSRG